MSALEAKIVVLGSQNVGKTSLVHRLVHSNFLAPNTPSTVGASFVTTRVHDPDSDSTIRLQIWDTAGQERFRSISRLYYRGAQAAVLCYDITSKRSFDDMGVWLRELRDSVGSGSNISGNNDVIVHIVGTKADIVAEDPSKREVPFERCIEYVQNELYAATSISKNQQQTNPPPQPQSQLTRSWSSARSRPAAKSAMTEKQPLHGLSKKAATQQQTPVAPENKRGSGFWGTQETVWDCCHEISAKDGSGIDQVFKVMTRKLIEQHKLRVETQRAIDTAMGNMDRQLLGPHTPSVTPAMTPGLGGARGSALQLQQQQGAGYFDLPASNAGSFRLGHGDQRRSWLGLTANNSLANTPGAVSSAAYTSDEGDAEVDIARHQQKSGRCC